MDLGNSGVKWFVDGENIFSFESDLAKAIGGTCSGGFGIEKNEHEMTGIILYKSFQNPIRSVT